MTPTFPTLRSAAAAVAAAVLVAGPAPASGDSATDPAPPPAPPAAASTEGATTPASPAAHPDTNAPAATPAPASGDTNAPANPIPTDGKVWSPKAAAPMQGVSLDSFRIISDRNIFNPNRSPRVPEREVTRRDTERRVRTESIALLGTMSYEKGDFAFFEGSSSANSKVLRQADTIAGFTIAAVTPEHVVLVSSASTGDTNLTTVTNAGAPTRLTLPIGMQLRRHDEGPWEIAERAATTGGYGGSASSSSSSTSPGGGGSDEVLKRLMQQREQDAGGASANTPASPSAEPNAPTPTTVPGNAPAEKPATPAAPAGGGEDEILKRLMQRREQENK